MGASAVLLATVGWRGFKLSSHPTHKCLQCAPQSCVMPCSAAGSDAAPGGVRDRSGSRGLTVLLANDPAATASTSSRVNVGAAADPGSSGSQSLQQQRSSKLARSHRHSRSRSCSHLPDALQAGAVGGFSWASRGGRPSVGGGGSHEEGLGAAAAPSVELLLAQPREAFRRRQGGRWGRRRIVLESGEQQDVDVE